MMPMVPAMPVLLSVVVHVSILLLCTSARRKTPGDSPVVGVGKHGSYRLIIPHGASKFHGNTAALCVSDVSITAVQKWKNLLYYGITDLLPPTPVCPRTLVPITILSGIDDSSAPFLGHCKDIFLAKAVLLEDTWTIPLHDNVGFEDQPSKLRATCFLGQIERGSPLSLVQINVYEGDVGEVCWTRDTHHTGAILSETTSGCRASNGAREIDHFEAGEWPRQ